MGEKKVKANTVGENWDLYLLNIKVKFYNFTEYLRVCFYFYWLPKFALSDLFLLTQYLLSNPFRVARKFLQKHGVRDPYSYGETPLTTLKKIARECELSANDRLYELGCGRGRTCFWLADFVACRVTGLELVPTFIRRAERVLSVFPRKNLSFRQANFFLVDYSDATVLFIYGTCMEEDEVLHLIQVLDTLPLHARVITVSYALSEYEGGENYRVLKSFSASFTWGEGTVYLQEKQPGKLFQ